jgi:hypothetical protein
MQLTKIQIQQMFSPPPHACDTMETISSQGGRTDLGGYWWPPTCFKFQLAHIDNFEFNMFLCNGDISL